MNREFECFLDSFSSVLFSFDHLLTCVPAPDSSAEFILSVSLFLYTFFFKSDRKLDN